VFVANAVAEGVGEQSVHSEHVAGQPTGGGGQSQKSLQYGRDVGMQFGVDVGPGGVGVNVWQKQVQRSVHVRIVSAGHGASLGHTAGVTVGVGASLLLDDPQALNISSANAARTISRQHLAFADAALFPPVLRTTTH
jgi:hypothetical protein